jgi:hypothetical protein
VNTPVLLAGSAWRVDQMPEGARPELAAEGPLFRFVARAKGQYVLTDADDRKLALRAGRYDATPLECGRGDCHAELVAEAQKSPMTDVLRRALAAPTHEYPRCALGCHATGEAGFDDGGLFNVAQELGPATLELSFAADSRHGPSAPGTRWDTLPAPLARLSGVGCLACHGPSTLPPPHARQAVLSAAVCAVCHDAPPRYGHVAAWRTSRMAQADVDPRTRQERCARCHTTAGFVSALGDDRLPANGAELAGTSGIACAACHAVHDAEHRGPERPLLRHVQPPSVLRGAKLSPADALCAGCHAPEGDGAVSASSSVLVAGQGGLDPETGAPLAGPAPHAAIDRGCLGCHDGGPDVERGRNHAFRARADGCATCHPRDALRVDQIAARARSLLGRLESRGLVSAQPAHAGTPKFDLSTPLGRAAYDALLVAEDPAAGVHNAPYAERLLAAAESVLGGQR